MLEGRVRPWSGVHGERRRLLLHLRRDEQRRVRASTIAALDDALLRIDGLAERRELLLRPVRLRGGVIAGLSVRNDDSRNARALCRRDVLQAIVGIRGRLLLQAADRRWRG